MAKEHQDHTDVLSAIITLPFKDSTDLPRYQNLIALAEKVVFLSHFQAFHAILATVNYGQKDNKATQKYVCEIVCTYSTCNKNVP